MLFLLPYPLYQNIFFFCSRINCRFKNIYKKKKKKEMKNTKKFDVHIVWPKLIWMIWKPIQDCIRLKQFTITHSQSIWLNQILYSLFFSFIFAMQQIELGFDCVINRTFFFLLNRWFSSNYHVNDSFHIGNRLLLLCKVYETILSI